MSDKWKVNKKSTYSLCISKKEACSLKRCYLEQAAFAASQLQRFNHCDNFGHEPPLSERELTFQVKELEMESLRLESIFKEAFETAGKIKSNTHTPKHKHPYIRTFAHIYLNDNDICHFV